MVLFLVGALLGTTGLLVWALWKHSELLFELQECQRTLQSLQTALALSHDSIPIPVALSTEETTGVMTPPVPLPEQAAPVLSPPRELPRPPAPMYLRPGAYVGSRPYLPRPPSSPFGSPPLGVQQPLPLVASVDPLGDLIRDQQLLELTEDVVEPRHAPTRYEAPPACDSPMARLLDSPALAPGLEPMATDYQGLAGYTPEPPAEPEPMCEASEPELEPTPDTDDASPDAGCSNDGDDS